MRFAFAALLLAFSLLLPGCIGSPPAKSANVIPIDDAGGVEAAARMEMIPSPQPEAPEAAASPAVAPSAGATPTAQAGNATAPAYVNYCYPTYWKGALKGAGRALSAHTGCGDYDYSMEISVRFTVPFDLAAYLARKDFNFNDCPGMPSGAANGSRDISIDGSFNSTRKITSQVTGSLDRRPDAETTSAGALYVSQPYGLALAAFPRQQAGNASWKYPYIVVDRCTWDRGIQTLGHGEAVILGADSGGFSYASDMKSVSGKWAMNGTLAGTYTLERTGLR